VTDFFNGLEANVGNVDYRLLIRLKFAEARRRHEERVAIADRAGRVAGERATRARKKLTGRASSKVYNDAYYEAYCRKWDTFAELCYRR
jgi:hypothetical protein